MGFEVVQGLGGGSSQAPCPPFSSARKCLWDLDIPWDRM